MEMNYEKIISFVKAVKPFFFEDILKENIEEKAKADYVTNIDKKVQKYLKKKLTEEYPKIAFYAEEQKNKDIDLSKSYWILDPVDGTTNLVYGINISAVSLALYDEKEVCFGVVYNPFNEETFVAVKGKGAYLNREKIKVSHCQMFDRALIEYIPSVHTPEIADKLYKVFGNILYRVGGFRNFGSAALELCYVACGRCDAFFQANLKPWDCAAAILTVKEAGGRVFDFEGNNKLETFENQNIIACTPEIENELYENFI